MNDHCGRTTVQPSDGLSVPSNQKLYRAFTQTKNHVVQPGSHMPGAGDTFTTSGAAAQPLPENNLDNLSKINSPVHAGAGGAAGPAIAVCVCACCECVGGRVCCARNASDAFLSTLPLRPVVARHSLCVCVCVVILHPLCRLAALVVFFSVCDKSRGAGMHYVSP